MRFYQTTSLTNKSKIFTFYLIIPTKHIALPNSLEKVQCVQSIKLLTEKILMNVGQSEL